MICNLRSIDQISGFKDIPHTRSGRFSGQDPDLCLKLGDAPLCVFCDGRMEVRQMGTTFMTCLRRRGRGLLWDRGGY